jgi:hypothetical protein
MLIVKMAILIFFLKRIHALAAKFSQDKLRALARNHTYKFVYLPRLIFEYPFIFFMGAPFKNYGYDFNALPAQGVQQSPAN